MCNCNENLTDLRYAALEKTLEKYQGKSGKIIPALQETQEIFGYLPDDAIKAIAAALKVPSSEIFGVATFYGQFHLQAAVKILSGSAPGLPAMCRAVVRFWMRSLRPWG
jgi:NADH:ubiquinone oxidoreductase subunit E